MIGDVYVAKIGVGCCCYLYAILTKSPPTLRPELHSVFPVIVGKARKYFIRVKQILEWHNRVEATMMSEIEYTEDDQGQQYTRDTVKAAASDPTTTAAPPSIETKSRDKPPQGSSTLPIFAIDFVSRRNIWEGRGILEVFANGLAYLVVTNPQFMPECVTTRKSEPSAVDDDDDDDDDNDEKDAGIVVVVVVANTYVWTEPRPVVPDIVGAQGRRYKWSDHYRNFTGVIVNEGPRKELRVCYVQGKCVR